MQRQLVFTTVFAAALAVGAAAQTGSATPGQPQTDKPQQITVTGCLQQAPSSAGTSGSATSGAASSAQQFVLNNASIGAPKSGSTGTAGAATSAPASPSAASSYKLMGQQDDLRKNVNFKVEIRGTLDRSAAGSSAAGTAAGSAPSSENMPTLRVTSVRKIADTCSPN